MRLKLRINRKSIFYQYILSYIVVFLMPFTVLGGILMFTSISRVSSETEAASQRQLEQTAQQLDNRLNELRTTAASVAYDNRLSRTNIESDRAGDAAYNLSRYKAGSTFIDELVVYYQGEDYVLTTKGRVSMEVFLRGHYDVQSLHGRPFMDFLNDSASYPVSTNDFAITDQGSLERVLFFNYPLPPGTRAIGAVVCVVRERDLASLLGQEQQEGAMLLFDYNGDRILGGLPQEEEGLYPQILQADNDARLRYAGRDYHVACATSSVFGWRLVRLDDYRAFTHTVSSLRNSLLVLLLLIQVCGVLLVVFQARRSAAPIHGILSKIGSKRAADDASEIDLINAAIEEAVEENESLKSQLDLQYNIVKDQMLLKLLYGKVDQEERTSLETTLGKDIKDPGYFVALFSFGRSDADNKTRMREEFLQSISVYNDGVNMFSIELLRDNAIAYIAVVDNKGYVREMQEEIARRMERLAVRLRLSGTIGVGQVYRDVNDINKSFVDATTATEYRLASGGVQVVFFDDIVDRQDEFAPVALKEKMLLKQSVKQGNAENAEEILGHILADIREKEPSLMIARLSCMELVNEVMEVVRELGMELPGDVLGSLLLFENLDSFDQSFRQLVHMVADYAVKMRSSQNDILVSDILQYIRDNMASCNISLKEVADRFGLSTTYLSRLIKQNIGYTFTDYLVELRLDEAKRLLRETELPVKDIVSRVGYIDLASFTRKFKLSEGKTPGQYRRD